MADPGTWSITSVSHNGGTAVEVLDYTVPTEASDYLQDFGPMTVAPFMTVDAGFVRMGFKVASGTQMQMDQLNTVAMNDLLAAVSLDVDHDGTPDAADLCLPSS